MKKERYFTIDALRGLAILVMILIHTDAYFLSIPVAAWMWDVNQWAVPVFIFCSAYVYFQKNKLLFSLNSWRQYIKKRVWRLMMPYYLFTVVYFVFNLIAEPKKLTHNYIVSSLILTDGIDINWLVLLFIMFIAVMPLIQWLARKRKWLFYLFGTISLVSSILLIFIHFPYNYRLIMWLPWSVLIIFTWYFVKYEKNIKFLTAAIVVSAASFFAVRLLEITINHSLTQYNNKYPPTIYHLSYGVFFILLLYFLAEKGAFTFSPIKILLNFLSRYSYSLFFIHYLVIYYLTVFLKWQFTWMSFFIWVFGISVATQTLINVFQRYIKVRRFGYSPVRAS